MCWLSSIHRVDTCVCIVNEWLRDRSVGHACMDPAVFQANIESIL